MIRLMRAEWKKIWLPKLSRLLLLFIPIASALVGLLFALTTQVTQERTLSELSAMSIIEVNMLGVDVATILLLLFAAMHIGREFQGKTIQTYLAATPARHQYFTAKALLYTFVALAISILVALITFMDGRLLISAVHKQMPPLAEVLRFAAGCIVMPPFYVLLTVCAAFSARNTAGGIILPLFVIFLPTLTEFFPSTLQQMVVPALPASAIHTLSGIAQKGSIEYTGVVAASIVLISWVALSCASAVWKLSEKDI